MEHTITSLKMLNKALADDAHLQNAFKNDPVKAMEDVLKNRVDPAYLKDRIIYRIIVFALGLSVISIVIGVLILVGLKNVKDGDIPTILTAIGSAAIGAIAGLLAPPPGKPQP